MSQLDMYLKLEKAREELAAAKKKYNFLKQENAKLSEELKKHKTWEIDSDSVATKEWQ